MSEMNLSKEPDALRPPVPARKSHGIQVHGQTLEDAYFWLRERANPEVIQYLNDENAYTQGIMNPHQALIERLNQELVGRIKETDQNAPVQRGHFWYYSRTVQGLNYPIYCRKKETLAAPEEILLDLNALAAGKDYLQLGAFKLSPDQRLLAYSLDTDGSERFTIQVLNLETQTLLADNIPGTCRSLEWSEDGRYFFYTLLDEARRPYRLYRHALGSAEPDVLIYEETDESFNLALSKTRDRAYLVLTTASSITSEVRLLGASDPLGHFKLAEERRRGVEYYLDHQGPRFLVLTNDEARNFRLMQTPEDSLGRAHWRELVGHRPAVKLETVECFRSFLVLEERENGLTHFRLLPVEGSASYRMHFPEPVYAVSPGPNPEYDSPFYRFNYTSLVAPPSTVDYEFQSRQQILRKQTEVLGGYRPEDYKAERLFARSHDGVEVPVSLVYKKGTPLDGSAPMLLYGYGSYGISIDPEFSSTRISLLDRGVIFAIAHIRGGGDLGRPWYEEGKWLKKKNTFLDFIACAETLIEKKYTSANRLAIMGGSAGGMLMGAVTTQRPELFCAVVAKVPFVDVVNTMLDKSLPLTVGEYEEWGNPEEKNYFDYMRSYSPYDQTSRQKYPHILITGGLYDPRVQYWEPAKWCARLRENNLGDSLILLKMNMQAGHGGASGRYDYLREIAFEYAFLLTRLGCAETARSKQGA